MSSPDCVFSPAIVSTLSNSYEGSSIRYALRSREISFEGSGGKGLSDLSLRVGGKGRGGKDFLSKAQDREKVVLTPVFNKRDIRPRGGKIVLFKYFGLKV